MRKTYLMCLLLTATLARCADIDLAKRTDSTHIGTATAAEVAAVVGHANTLNLGTTGTTAGILGLIGSTSGVVSITGGSTAGTWTFTVPPNAGTNGYALTTNGSGVTGWSVLSAAGGGTGVTALGTGVATGLGTNINSGAGFVTTTGAATLTNKTLDGVLSVATTTSFRFDTSLGEFHSSTGENFLHGQVTLCEASTPSLDTSSGMANTGYLAVQGKTSGQLKITTADATAQDVIVTAAAQTVGSATLTIPNMANVSDTFVFATKSATLSNKTFVAPALGTPISGDLSNCTGFPLVVLVGTSFNLQTATQGAANISTTTSGYTASGMSCSINIMSNTSKIRIRVTGGAVVPNTNVVISTIYRDGSDVLSGMGSLQLIQLASATDSVPNNIDYVDSPATTGVVTYEVYFANTDNATTVYFNSVATRNIPTRMTLEEIKQ